MRPRHDRSARAGRPFARLRCLAGVVIVCVLPVTAHAHGEHAGAMPLGQGGLVTVEGYQVELLGRPSRLVVGRESHIVAKVFTLSSLEVVIGGTVLISVAPAEAGHALQVAPETLGPGTYTVRVTPTRTGPHVVRVALAQLGGRRFDPPLVVDYRVSVGRTFALGTGMVTLAALLGAVTVAGMYAVAVKARLGRPAQALDLLALAWVRRLLTSPAFQLSLQVPMLGLMAAVALLGLFDVQDGGVNVATKLTWTIWWAGIIFTFFLVGRAWCLACPFGALNEWAARLAAPLRRLPRPFRNIWWATGMFVLLTWADEQLGVVRSPRVTAWIVLFFAGLAVLVGLFYQRRSFCRYLCPIGGVIGVYSMTAPLELRVKNPAACRADTEKPCYRGGDATRGCPMFEFPLSMDRNNYCFLCGECVKGCPHDNLVLRLRGFGQDLWASGRRLLEESYLAVLLVGLTFLVTAEMLDAWSGWVGALVGWLPGPLGTHGVAESAVLLGGALVVAPLLALGAAALADRLAGGHGLGIRQTFVVFGYMFVPVGLAMHLAHNLSHLLLEGGGIVPAVQRAVMLYTPFFLGMPEWRVSPLAPEAAVRVLQMLCILGFFGLSCLAGHRLALRVYPDPRSASRALIPLVALSFALTLVAIVLLNQPMAMRHGA